MSAVPKKYQPTKRLIDNPQRLETLYCNRDLSVREIADRHATVGRTRVNQALQEHGISRETTSNVPTTTSVDVQWHRLND